MSGESLDQLLTQAQSGDKGALDRLCQRFLPSLRTWARGRLPAKARDLMDTDDLVQETFVGVLGRLDDFRPKHDEALQAYLRVSLVNRLRDEIRKLPRKPTLVVDREDLVAREPSPFEELLGVELHTKYREALGRLRPEDRDLLEAKLDRDLDYAEPPR